MKTEKDWLKCGDPAKLIQALFNRRSEVWWAPCSREPSDRKRCLISCGIASVTSYAGIPPDPFILNWYDDIESGNFDPDSHSIGSDWTQSSQAKDFAGSADLVRDILGNPFRPSWRDRKVGLGKVKWMGSTMEGSIIGPAPPWLTPRVKAMAQGIYGEFDFASLPILADLLEDEGCDCKETLRHFRGQERCLSCLEERNKRDKEKGDWLIWCNTCDHGWLKRSVKPHYRGCWALDLLLGRE